MSLRRLTGILAAIAVLVHAAALVRHNGVMLGALLKAPELSADLAQICHGAALADATASVPAPSTPGDVERECPICSGLGPAFIDLARATAGALLLRAEAAPAHPRSEDIVRAAIAPCPPARGPPLDA